MSHHVHETLDPAAVERAADLIRQADALIKLLNPAPRCPHCGGLARPNVLMFSDWGWIDDRSAAQPRPAGRRPGCQQCSDRW